MNRERAIPNRLRTLPFFAGVEDSALLRFAAAAVRRSYSAYQHVLLEGTDRDGLFIVEEGLVESYRTSPTGDELSIDTLEAGEVFGLTFLSPEVEVHSALRALVNGTVIIHTPRAAFEQLVASAPAIALRAIAVLGVRYVAVCDRYTERSFCPVHARLARELVRQATAGNTLTVDLSYRQLAARVGARRSEVSRVMAEWGRKGLISTTRGRRGITILDLEAIRRYAELSE